jgi:fructose-bisphosphate aldolase class II
MSIINSKKILRNARENNYAVGGFDCWNLESVIAVIDAAEETQSPVIILTGPHGLAENNRRIEYFGAIARVAAQQVSVPVAIQLNEAKDFSLVIKAIQCGFTSVMLESSELSLEKNIKVTKEVVKIAHSVDVSVESQLGAVPVPEELIKKTKPKSSITNPTEAKKFVDNTGIDALAISFGNVHFGKSQEIEFDLIKQIANLVSVPLVVHGGSGFPKKHIGKTIECGCNKFNVGFILRKRFANYIKENINKPISLNSSSSYVFIENILKGAKEEMEKEVIKWMQILGCAGKSKLLNNL